MSGPSLEILKYAIHTWREHEERRKKKLVMRSDCHFHNPSYGPLPWRPNLKSLHAQNCFKPHPHEEEEVYSRRTKAKWGQAAAPNKAQLDLDLTDPNGTNAR